jgi:hypothetical protein
MSGVIGEIARYGTGQNTPFAGMAEGMQGRFRNALLQRESDQRQAQLALEQQQGTRAQTTFDQAQQDRQQALAAHKIYSEAPGFKNDPQGFSKWVDGLVATGLIVPQDGDAMKQHGWAAATDVAASKLGIGPKEYNQAPGSQTLIRQPSGATETIAGPPDNKPAPLTVEDRIRIAQAGANARASNAPPVIIQSPTDPTKTVYGTREQAVAGAGTPADAKAAQDEQAQIEANNKAIDQGRQSLDIVKKQIDELTPMLNASNTGIVAKKDAHGNWVHPTLAGLNQGLSDVEAKLNTITSNAFAANLNSMKNTKGQTALGRVLAVEVPMISNKLAAIKQEQNALQLKNGLVDLYRQMVILQKHLEQARAQDAKSSPAAPNAKPGAIVDFHQLEHP